MNHDPSATQTFQTPPSGRLDAICEAFEAAWKSDQPPRIQDCLSQIDSADEPTRRRLLIELLKVDLDHRWRTAIASSSLGSTTGTAGVGSQQSLPMPADPPARPLAEDYVAAFPALGSVVQVPRELIAEEYRVRRRFGDKPSREHYATRCPHCHNPIELVDDTPLAEIDCPSCGSSFGLVGDEALAHQTQGGTLRRRTVFGHFELLEQLGAGAFGTVWKARDTKLDRIVALKIPRHGQLSPEETEKFVREARAAAQVRHPHIVCVHDGALEFTL